MNGYLFALSCTRCGSECRPMAEGRPHAGTEASAVARCCGCGSVWHVHVVLRPGPADPKQQRDAARSARYRARKAMA